MINILLKDHDSFYVNGMTHFLNGLFLREMFTKVTFTTDFSLSGISQADLIVMSLCRGESLTCIPELLSRKRGLLIGVVDDNANGNGSNLPNCLADIIFIQRNENLKRIRQKILSRIEQNTLPNWKSRLQGCSGCLHQNMSPQQLRIMTRIYQGKSVEVIAREMNVTDKTVFSHKYKMMSKFNLCSDYELLNFLKKLAVNNAMSNVFRESLGSEDLTF